MSAACSGWVNEMTFDQIYGIIAFYSMFMFLNVEKASFADLIASIIAGILWPIPLGIKLFFYTYRLFWRKDEQKA